MFLSFAIEPARGGTVENATLSSKHFHQKGTPFEDLGALQLEEMAFARFSPDLWNQDPVAGGLACTFATSANGPFSCDVTQAVQRALDDGRSHVQFRLRFERAGDSDGAADIAMFYLHEMNVNESGCFEIDGVLR